MGSGQTQVLAAVAMVALTVLVAGVFYGATSLSQPEEPFNPDSPFDERFASAGLVLDDDSKATRFDGRHDAVLGSGLSGYHGSPKSIDDAVEDLVDSLSHQPPPPTTFTENTLRIDSGGYHLDTNHQWWGWTADDRVIFDTSDGDVRIGLTEQARLSVIDADVEVEGDGVVEIYVVSGQPYDVQFANVDVDADGRTEAIRIYVAARDTNTGTVEFESFRDGTMEFEGIVYAPDHHNVYLEDAEFYGALVAGTAELDRSSYYHDVRLQEGIGEDEGLGFDQLP